MGNRLTKEWLPDLRDVFGENGGKGTRGEHRAVAFFRELGYDVEYYPSNKDVQLSNIDMFLVGMNGQPFIERKLYGIDAKNNLKTNGDVGVDVRMIGQTKSTFIIHLNDDDKNDRIIYKSQHMKDYLRKHRPTPRGGCYWVSREVAKGLK